MYTILFFAQIVLIYLTSKKVTYAIFFRLNKIIKKQNALKLFSILFLPGTFLHEAAHYIIAKILLVHVENFSLVPEYENDGIKLGTVSIGKTDPIRRFIIGIAPVLVGIVIVIYLSYLIGIRNNYWEKAILIAVVFSVANSMFSSKKDMEGAAKMFITIILVTAIIFYLGIDIKIDISQENLSTIQDLTRRSVELLIIPIGINFTVLLANRLFK